MNLPDSMDELQQRFVVRVHPTPKAPPFPTSGPNLKETEIYSSVLHNLIHVSWGFLLKEEVMNAKMVIRHTAALVYIVFTILIRDF